MQGFLTEKDREWLQDIWRRLENKLENVSLTGFLPLCDFRAPERLPVMSRNSLIRYQLFMVIISLQRPF